jgi:hypothetical protein
MSAPAHQVDHWAEDECQQLGQEDDQPDLAEAGEDSVDEEVDHQQAT